jgi:hypothetical protein
MGAVCNHTLAYRSLILNMATGRRFEIITHSQKQWICRLCPSSGFLNTVVPWIASVLQDEQKFLININLIYERCLAIRVLFLPSVT